MLLLCAASRASYPSNSYPFLSYRFWLAVQHFTPTAFPNSATLSSPMHEIASNGNIVFDGTGTVTAQALGSGTEIEFWSSWGVGSGTNIAFNGGAVTVS